ncbi:hypothetical protein FVR03_20190 [Pontibacter qinzhouensis]|uniref:Uncharacterized protein n=1 Tax=Pontibacter qinzhouensis TaxID=2603253 RepID=A0A5C8J4L6_9BACT|nr:hypothetical protein [Pontibacter qinzhouensis]TXK30863.1 hypothetical protein FVR03_20190 [Pontibacter qinzhouensis]
MATDNIIWKIPGNRLHDLSEILAEICYNGSNYYDENKAEEMATSVKRLFYTIEHYMRVHPEYRKPTDLLRPVTYGEVSRVMVDSIHEFGNKLLENGDFIDSLHNKPIDVNSILTLTKNVIRKDKIQQVTADV